MVWFGRRKFGGGGPKVGADVARGRPPGQGSLPRFAMRDLCSSRLSRRSDCKGIGCALPEQRWIGLDWCGRNKDAARFCKLLGILFWVELFLLTW